MGNDTHETLEGLAWIRRVLFAPDWRMANLSRLRDVVAWKVSQLRNTMSHREEAWVRDPAGAYWRQGAPLLLATASFLTRQHNAHRLRWLLEDPGDAGFSGSLVVAEFDSLEDAETWASDDPYKHAGVYGNVTVKPFKKVLP